MYKFVLFFILFFCCGQNYSQELSARKKRKIELMSDPLAPSKAAFYSAVFPGLGQLYSGNAWKVPLVYAAIGSAVYSYVYNKSEYNKYRGIYKRRIAGYKDDEYIDLIPQNDKILKGMDFHKRYRDMSFIFIIGTYMLNILEANVSTHLMQFNVNDDLSFKPNIDFEPISDSKTIGFVVKLKF
mgnify:FL=1